MTPNHSSISAVCGKEPRLTSKMVGKHHASCPCRPQAENPNEETLEQKITIMEVELEAYHHEEVSNSSQRSHVISMSTFSRRRNSRRRLKLAKRQNGMLSRRNTAKNGMRLGGLIIEPQALNTWKGQLPCVEGGSLGARGKDACPSQTLGFRQSQHTKVC